ncbi:MAG: magnesium-translocating P-type ATPase [Acidobacteriota bacterium]|nr:MAG: magnesium-translocating P-type ATPase [Acidobacteriota bacterium]
MEEEHPSRSNGLGWEIRRTETPSDRLCDSAIDELFAELRSSPEGLSADESAARISVYGENRISDSTRRSTFRLLVSQFESPITVLLIAAAVLSVGLGDSTDGAIILGIVLVSGLLGFWQEHRASGAVQALLEGIRISVKVRRSGVAEIVPIERVVPGDIVILEAGSGIPGDCRLIVSRDFFVDESALTGESYPSQKSENAVGRGDRNGCVYLGSHAVSGTAEALVVCTGRETVYGEISRAIAASPPETEFQHGIRRFGILLLEIAIVLSLTIFAINVAFARPVLESLLFTLALTVGLAPQLLPAILSITLSHGARRMAARSVIVKRLGSIEDIGGIDILCTDKTGTLTEGTVRLAGATDSNGDPSDSVILMACLNAAFETGFANPIDEELRRVLPAEADEFEKIDEVPYDFIRKRLSIAVRRGDEDLLITKGAVLNVLEVCDTAELPDGSNVSIETVRDRVMEHLQDRSKEGVRCLGVARKRVERGSPINKDSETGLVFLGLLMFFDPPKVGVADDLHSIKKLGIRLKLLTGDNRHVAGKIAGDLGFRTASVVTGSEIARASDTALRRIVERADVFAELDPNQKQRLIMALKSHGHAVGFLGDGINDAAALHAADAGISVDTAVDVTKQAADVILLEKDLGVLADGIREGRAAYANTLKYVFITTSANFGNMFSMAAASLFAPFLPMLPKQILLLNVLSDLPAMAIASDKLDLDQVKKPKVWDIGAIRKFMIVFGLVSSVFDFVTFGTLLLLRVPTGVFRTAWFVESTLSEILILLVIRTRKAFFLSLPGNYLVIACATVAVMVLIVPYTPAAEPLGFSPLPSSIVFLIALILAAYVLASEIAKRFFFRGAGKKI